jgi:cytochrome b6-f complex iron-sulfur subunit
MAKNEKAPAEEEQLTVNRREFLNLAWLASLGFLTASLGGVTILFAFPRFKEGEFGGVFNIGGTSRLPAVGQNPVNNPAGKFWLTRTEEGVRAIYKVCTHLGCLYAWQEQEFKFICPCHGSQFTYESEFILGPAPRSLDLFVMRAVDSSTGEVLAETTDPNSTIPVFDNPNVEYEVDTGSRINGKPIGAA